MSLATKFVSFDRLKRYTQHVKSYVGLQILNAKGEWAKQLNLKVDKVEGKGLSTNDFTNELKNKLNGIEAGAQVNTVTGIKGNAESAYRQGNVNLTPANIGAVASSNGDASNTKVTFTQSTSRVNLTSGDTLKTAFGKLSKWFVDLKAVAFSGSYNDLSNKPTTLKNPKSLTIQQNGGNQTEYDGSTELTVNITKAGIGLGNVENKSSATIRSELTSSNVTTALGYTPINSSATNLTDQNLDAYKGTDYMGKMYYGAGSNSVTGKPSGVDNFWMWVTRNGSGVFSQILMDNKCQLYIRYHNANSWSTWKQVISSGNNISLLNNDKGYQTLQQVEDKINEIVSSSVGQITTFSFQVVEKLPSSGTSNHIYLVPISGSTESDNYYEEYCYINSKWELIGTTKVDLTAYAKKTDIPTALKNPNAMTLQINGTSQGTYDGSAAKTYNVSKEGLGLGNVENKSSATIRGELTSANVTKALGFTPISKVTVDSALSSTSTNPVQNKVIKAELDKKASTAVATTSTNGLMSSTDKSKLDGIASGANKTVVDSALSSSSTNPVQNKVVNSALSRKLTKTNTDYNAETICLCTHSKSGTVHTLVKKNDNDSYSTVKFVATADFTYGDTFRFGSASSPTVVTPKTEDGKLLTTGAFKKGSVVIAYTGDTTETVNTLFFKGGGGVDISGATAEEADVIEGKTFYSGDNTIKTGTLEDRSWSTNPVSFGRDDSNRIYVRIPKGAYRTVSSGSGYPEILFPGGDATSADVRAGKTFRSGAGTDLLIGGAEDIGISPEIGYAYSSIGKAYTLSPNNQVYFSFTSRDIPSGDNYRTPSLDYTKTKYYSVYVVNLSDEDITLGVMPTACKYTSDGQMTSDNIIVFGTLASNTRTISAGMASPYVYFVEPSDLLGGRTRLYVVNKGTSTAKFFIYANVIQFNGSFTNMPEWVSTNSISTLSLDPVEDAPPEEDTFLVNEMR